MKKTTLIKSFAAISSFIILMACNKEISNPSKDTNAGIQRISAFENQAITKSSTSYTGGTSTGDSIFTKHRGIAGAPDSTTTTPTGK